MYIDLGNDTSGHPIPKLRVLIYLPLKDRRYALKPLSETSNPKHESEKQGQSEANESLGYTSPHKIRKTGVVVHLAGGGFTM